MIGAVLNHGPLALVGSGEYLPVMTDVEAMLIDGRPPRYVQLPTAAAPEGERSLRHWIDLGAAQADRIGVEQIPVVVRDREEADSPELAALIAGAGLIYLSGGNPMYLAQTLRGTRVWDAILASWQSGSALAGCSAGAIALTGWVPSMRAARSAGPDPGLGVLPDLRVLPHFDKKLGWVPDLLAQAVLRPPNGTTVLGIDEDTALVDMTGAGHTWQVYGRQQVWVLTDGPRRGYPAGSKLITPLIAGSPVVTRGDDPTHPRAAEAGANTAIQS
jgi:cyanophycinase